MDKRLLMGGFSFYNSVLTIMFAALLLLYGAQAWHILTYVFLVGIGMSMEAPARTSYVTTVVPDRTLLNAFALLSVAYNVAKVIGPASAGFILALLGPGRTIFIPAALMLAAGLIVSRLKFVAPARHIESKRSVPEQILEGMVAMTGNPVVVALFLTQVVVYGIMVPATYGLLPIYAADVFLVGPAGLGLLTSACGVGAIFGVLITATLGIRLPRGKASLVVLAISAIAMIGFAGTTSFYVSIVMLGIFNAGIVSLTAIKSSGIQSLVPQNTRGRVAALTTMANGVGPIGSLAFGACAQTFDAPTATVVAAVAVFVSISCLYFKWPQLTKFR
jgi:MFS family permease